MCKVRAGLSLNLETNCQVLPLIVLDNLGGMCITDKSRLLTVGALFVPWFVLRVQSAPHRMSLNHGNKLNVELLSVPAA